MQYVIAVGAVVGILWCGYYLFGAAIDNRIGYLLERDLRAVRQYQVNGESIESLVALTHGGCQWTAVHPEEVWRTFVTCRAADGSVFYWEVNRDYSPEHQRPSRGTFICALTRRTAVLTPSLAAPGLDLLDYPEQPNVRASILFERASSTR